MKYLCTSLFVVCCFSTIAQLKIDTTMTIDSLIDNVLVGKGIRVGNVVLNGNKLGIGYFQTDSAVIGMNSGVLLSTGFAMDAAGENDTPGKSGVLYASKTYSKKQYKKVIKGDKDLNKICKGRTKDVNIIEFDFVPFDNHVVFNFSFGSEEYKEYVGSDFNDVFAFIVDGPGVRKTNLAVIPGTKTPVTINTINHKKNNEFFIDNDYFINFGLTKGTGTQPKVSFLKFWWHYFFGEKNSELFYTSEKNKEKLNQVLVNHFQYDGFTTVLTADLFVKPFQKYHLKIAIGDAGDAIFDSGVFLEEGSFCSFKDTTHIKYSEYKDLKNYFNFDSIFGNYTYPSIPKIKEIKEQFEITDIYFDHDKYEILEIDKPSLDSLAIYLKSHPLYICYLTGYTDNTGSNKYNQKLSEKRAISVTKYLKSKGVEADRLIYEGNSFYDPIAENSSENGRTRNRRVEIIIELENEKN